MKIPTSLIQTFVTSEFNPKLNSSNEYIIKSPFVDDRKGKLYINKNDGRWIDFKGGDAGSFLKFVREYMGFNSNSEAVKYLVDNYDFKVEPVLKEEKEDINAKKILKDFILKDKPKLFGDVSRLGPFGKKAYEYVRARKLEEEYYSKLGYIFNPSSKFDKRIFIPFFENYKLVYFITRAVDPKNLIRYMNVDKLDSKNYVFNIDKINEEAIICEGTFDAMSITSDQAATCLLSADIGVKQMEKLFERDVKAIIYVPDNDETGHRKMAANIKKILTYCPYSGMKIYVYNLPDHIKDLNELKIKTGKNYILKKECDLWKGDIR